MKSIRKKIRELSVKYRLYVIDPETLKEIYTQKISGLKLLLLLFTLVLVVAAATFGMTRLLSTPHQSSPTVDELSKTPEITESIEEESVEETDPDIEALLVKIDSLQEAFDGYRTYVNNFSDVLTGNVTRAHDSLVKEDEITAARYTELNIDSIKPSKETEKLSQEFLEKGFSTVAPAISKEEEAVIQLFMPVKGISTSSYDIVENHLGIDIACDEGTPIKAALDGFVVFSGWTSDNGYTIILQHQQNIITQYKHNSKLYKKDGDIVQAGDVVAASGSTGEFSVGPHLHFELWIEGYAVDPAAYLSF